MPYPLGARRVTHDLEGISRVKIFLANGILSFQNAVLHLFTGLFYRKNKNPRSVLIFRTGSLGDSLCAIPAIRAIRSAHPEAKLDILSNAGRANLVGLHQLLEKEAYDEMIDYFGLPRLQLWKWLRGRNYDLIIQLPQVDASFFRILRDLFFFRSIASSGWGWHKSQVKLFRKTQARHLEFPNELDRLSGMLKKKGYVVAQSSQILKLKEEDISIANEFLEKNGLHADIRPRIAVVAGAKRPQNRWPVAYFQKVIEKFNQTHAILLIGSREDNQLVQPLTELGSVYNACGKLTPLQSAALISMCQFTISNDTGPMHLSYAVGTPTLALFSSRDLPGKWYPPAEGNKIFRSPGIACEACFSEICGNNICMQAIKVDRVKEAAEALMRVSEIQVKQ